MTTATCRHCRQPITKTRSGVWGTTDPNDGHPFYCDADPAEAKLHRPGPPPLITTTGHQEGT